MLRQTLKLVFKMAGRAAAFCMSFIAAGVLIAGAEARTPALAQLQPLCVHPSSRGAKGAVAIHRQHPQRWHILTPGLLRFARNDAGAAFPLKGLADATSPLYVEARHRWRRHRRSRIEREKEEGKTSRQESGKTADKPAQPSAPPPEEKQAPKEAGKTSTPEPMGPPPPPQEWSAAEVKAGQMDCDRRLSGLPILYDRLDPIREGACGLPAPIRLKGFEGGKEPGVRFSPAPTVSCKLAEALHRWFEDVVQPSAKMQLHASVVHISTLSAYNCRARYDDLSQRISQHAFANAVDIGEFVTAKGEHVAVLDHWSAGDERAAFLHKVHDGACEIFGTTLGPGANEAHKNHFHLDMKERRRPLCDFTPEQVQAQEEAKKHAPALPSAEAKVPLSGSDKPSTPGPQTKIAAVPAAPEKQAQADAKPASTEPDGRHSRRRHSRRHARYR
jgi:hypothetical protein